MHANMWWSVILTYEIRMTLSKGTGLGGVGIEMLINLDEFRFNKLTNIVFWIYDSGEISSCSLCLGLQWAINDNNRQYN